MCVKLRSLLTGFRSSPRKVDGRDVLRSLCHSRAHMCRLSGLGGEAGGAGGGQEGPAGCKRLAGGAGSQLG